MTYGFSKEALSALRPCDVIYTRSQSFISRAIRYFAKGWPSHVAMLLAPPDIIEATSAGIKINPLSSLNNKDAHALAIRVPGLTDKDFTRIQSAALADNGEPYPAPKLFLHLIDQVFYRGRYVARRWAFTKYNVCGAAVQSWLRVCKKPQALFPFDLDENQPDDMMVEQLKRGHVIVWATSREAVALLCEVYPWITI